jgi:putative ABC transport system permease protein
VFNLAGRMVEAERREIGICMALGWSRPRLALRHLLVGAQIALVGAVLGVVMTFVVLAAVRPIFESMLPLPMWRRPWQPSLFIQSAVMGFVLPLLATAWLVLLNRSVIASCGNRRCPTLAWRWGFPSARC